MARSFSMSITRAIILVILVFILIMAIGANIALLEYTLVKWWIPILISATVAAFSGTLLWKVWKRLTDINYFWVNFLCHLIFTTFLLSGLYLTINYAGSGNPHPEEACVVAKFREQHYRSRRVGRNRYVRGNPYWEYYIKVRLDDSSVRKIRINFKEYQNVRTDRNLILSLSKGALGLPVIHPDRLSEDNPWLKAPDKSRRCRFFGTHGK